MQNVRIAINNSEITTAARDSSHIISITGVESTILETGYSWNERGHFAEMTWLLLGDIK